MPEPPASDVFQPMRRQMVEEQLRPRGIRDPRVLEAMVRVPRHRFVPQENWSEAYGDHPIQIGQGQTISQPYIVAAMLEALALTPQDNVLEVGTGSGYQAALLSKLAALVESIERFASLAEKARAVLAELGCSNVRVSVGDGSEGLAEFAPYNGIIVSAAAPQVPAPLVEQLAEDGRLIVPVGTEEEQQLYLLRKTSGQPVISRLDGCRFVPLIGKSGFHRS